MSGLVSGTPITGESVGLLREGDLLLAVESTVSFSAGEVVVCEGVTDWGSLAEVNVFGLSWMPQRFTFIGRPDSEGWIAWEGGENPVPGQVVEVRFADAASTPPCLSDVSAWKHYGDAADIIAFRLSPSPVKAEGQSGEGVDAVAKGKLAAIIHMLEGMQDRNDSVRIYQNEAVIILAALRPSEQSVDWSVVGPELVEALQLILPLAKGYAPEGQTTTAKRTCASWIEAAEAALARTGAER
ncbi:hypothetical protein [Brevundimonas sp.]